MKFKGFQKISGAVNTQYEVFNKEEYKLFYDGKIENAPLIIDCFEVNYCEKDAEKLKKNILKRMKYENDGADVLSFDVINNRLYVYLGI